MDLSIKVDSSIPRDAKAIKVTNIINPYIMKIYELENHALKANAISRKLQLYAKENINFEEETNELLSLGDTLIVQNRINSEISAWWCRGILGHMTEESEDQTKYTVHMPDYGISLELPQTDFRKIPKNLVPDKYLSSTISLDNVIPASIAKNNKSKVRTFVNMLGEWTESAICFTKELISFAEKIYFHPRARVENEKACGELYLIIEDEIVLLSKALIDSLFAVNLSNALLTVIDHPDSIDDSLVKKLNDSLLITEDNLKETCSPKSKAIEPRCLKPSNSIHDAGSEDDNLNSQDSDCMNMRKVNENTFFKHNQEILIRCEEKCKIIENITDNRFSLTVHQALKAQKITHPMKIQSCMWPAVAKGLDVISISPSKSGKTYGYIVPIVSYLVTQKKLPKGTVPTTLVLCSTSSNVSIITSLFNEFSFQDDNINVVAALNGKPEKTLLAQIYNGCQVLVSTAPFLARFLKKYKSKISLDFSYLQHIILDQGDVILDKYMESTMELFIKHKIMRNKHNLSENDLSLQLIAVGEQWTKGLSQFMDKFTLFPFVCIGSYMEATAFSQVQAKLSLATAGQKNDIILEALKNGDPSVEKTMIICTDADEAGKLNNLLQSNGIKTLLAHSDMVFEVVKGIKDDWSASISGMYPVIICTDDVLSDLNIKDVKWLIHQSVDVATRSKFYYRFSTFRDSWHSNASKCKFLAIADDQNNRQFRGLIDIMQRLHASIPRQWIDAGNKIMASLDREKKKHPVCEKLQALGICPKRTTCPFRHCLFDDIDAPRNDISIGDTVELMVTRIHDTTHFSARLVKCIKNDKKKEPILYPPEHSVRLAMQMQKYFSNVENRRGRREINIGDICAMEDNIDHYIRVQVLRVVSKNNHGEPHVVSVRHIDDGYINTKVMASSLLHIPGHLEKWQTNIFEIFISGLEPYDKENEWDYCANDAVQSWFKEFFDSGSTIIGKVTLHLGNTIWTNTLEIRSKITGYPEFTVSSLKPYLIEKNHAKENKEHLPFLYQLCKTWGLQNLKFDEIDTMD